LPPTLICPCHLPVCLRSETPLYWEVWVPCLLAFARRVATSSLTDTFCSDSISFA
jgi:hypothetical protein